VQQTLAVGQVYNPEAFFIRGFGKIHQAGYRSVVQPTVLGNERCGLLKQKAGDKGLSVGSKDAAQGNSQEKKSSHTKVKKIVSF
jgi:hypothetical protein